MGFFSGKYKNKDTRVKTKFGTTCTPNEMELSKHNVDEKKTEEEKSDEMSRLDKLKKHR